ncbi:MAG: hypothetical protein ABIM89_05105 [Mycobacteriales bacterium]
MTRRNELVGIRAALVASVVLLAGCNTDSTTPLAGSPASTEPISQTTSLTASPTASATSPTSPTSPASPASPTTSVTTSPLASPTTKRAAPPDYKRLWDEPAKVPLAPGTYALRTNGGGGMPLALIDAPKGYTNYSSGGWLLESAAGGWVSYWTVSGVDRDPCDLAEGVIDPGTSVDELADALAAQKLTTTTKPVPVIVGGRAGLYLELTVPTAIDFANCGVGQFNVWVSDPTGGRYMQEPGQVDKLWIVDTEHGRVVLDASALSKVTDNQLRELTDMVMSVRFVEPN